MRRRSGPTRVGLASLLAGGLAAVGSLVVPASAQVAAPSGQLAAASLVPGDLVITRQSQGEIDAIDSAGQVRVLATGLANPTSVAVLADGSILVAETAEVAGAGVEGRISGFGGRFGPTPELVVALPTPVGLTATPEGAVYVTSLDQGLLRIDLDARQAIPVATGFNVPGDPSVRGDTIFVPEFAGGDVVAVAAATGQRRGTVVSGLATPTGTTAAPGLPLLVTDARGNRVVRVDEGSTTPDSFAEIDGPIQVAFVPATPAADSPWQVVVTSQVGVVRFDQTGKELQRVALPGLSLSGIAVVPDAVAPPTTASSVTTPTSTAPSTTLAAGEDGGPTTTVLKQTSDSTDASNIGVIVLVVIFIAALAGLVTWLAARRARQREGGELPFAATAEASSSSVAAAFGPCAAEEVELAEAQNALVQIEEQLQAIAGRVDDATRRVATAPLAIDELGCETAQGREAFEAFRRGELTADVLHVRWLALGEQVAIDRLQQSSEATAQAGVDLAEARAEATRFGGRERAARQRIEVTRAALDACLARQTSGRADPSELPAPPPPAPPPRPDPPAASPDE